jgi:hypothetical protein
VKRSRANRTPESIERAVRDNDQYPNIRQAPWKPDEARWYVFVSVGPRRLSHPAYTLAEVIDVRADLLKKRLDWLSMARAFRGMQQCATHPDEEWRSVSSQYEVSSQGRVRSWSTRKLLSPHKAGAYWVIHLCDNCSCYISYQTLSNVHLFRKAEVDGR